MLAGSEPFFIDSDNALGSSSGDIDDGYAIAALLKSGRTIEGLSSVFGNASEDQAYSNHQRLSRLCGFNGPILRGAVSARCIGNSASGFLSGAKGPMKILALGPLTNLALAVEANQDLAETVKEVVFVATNFSLSLPAFRFFDFNQWQDPRALRTVLASSLPLTVIPCDVARKLRLTRAQVRRVPGELGDYLRTHSERWFRRALWLKGGTSVPLWDAVAAMYALEPSLFEVRYTKLEIGKLGRPRYGEGAGRNLHVVTDFDPVRVWDAFLSTISW